MTGRLANRVALVTGASRGLGKSAALALARECAHVIAMARTQGGLTELDDEIRSLGGSATLVPADMRDYDAIDRLGAAIFERWKRLDILIGNRPLSIDGEDAEREAAGSEGAESKDAAKEPVKNADLWKLLDEQVNRHNVTWKWVRGHIGHHGNERADQLANRGVDEVRGYKQA